jgi:hypothetical protein
MLHLRLLHQGFTGRLNCIHIAYTIFLAMLVAVVIKVGLFAW